MRPRALVAALRERYGISTPQAKSKADTVIAKVRGWRDEGYEWEEIADLLERERIDVSIRTLQRYMSRSAVAVARR